MRVFLFVVQIVEQGFLRDFRMPFRVAGHADVFDTVIQPAQIVQQLSGVAVLSYWIANVATDNEKRPYTQADEPADQCSKRFPIGDLPCRYVRYHLMPMSNGRRAELE